MNDSGESRARFGVLLASLIAGLCGGCATVPAPIMTLQTSGSDASLRGLDVVDAETAWASGSGGTVLRTTDGGATWARCVVPEADDLDFRDVAAFDADNAVIMGVASPARFLRTSDGGATWTQVHFDDAAGVFYDGMAFWTDRHGIAFSDPVDRVLRIVTTDDAGRTWRAPSGMRMPPAREGEAGFAASGTSIALAAEGTVWVGLGGPGARLFRSGDFGVTWTAVETPLSQDAASAGIFSLVILPGGGGAMVGGDYTRADDRMLTAASSTDGESWTLAKTMPGGYRSGIARFDARGAIGLVTCGPNGTDWSTDGGRTWMPLGDEGFHAVQFAPGTAWGWMVGSEGRIARLTPESGGGTGE